MSVHDGHRQRMKERFYTGGLDGMKDHEVLEMLLFYCIPRRNTNEIAHRLLNEFKTLPRVFNATVKELEKVEGMGHNAATFISFVRQLDRFFDKEQINDEDIMGSMDKCYRYLVKRFIGRKNETVMLLCLDAKCMVLGCHIVGEGSINSAGVSIRKIVDIALSTNASSVILAHNHPSGIALPSPEDVQTTKRVATALHMVDVILNDHIVVADDDFVSILQSGLYKPEAVFQEI